jgi:hypothetical protein
MLAWLGGNWFKRSSPAGELKKMRKDLQAILLARPLLVARLGEETPPPQDIFAVRWWTENDLRSSLQRYATTLRAAGFKFPEPGPPK